MKKLNKALERDLYIETQPPDQFEENQSWLGDEIINIEDVGGGSVVFVDTLDPNQKAINPFPTRIWHNALIVSFLSDPSFDLPKSTVRNFSRLTFVLKQTSKNVESIF